MCLIIKYFIFYNYLVKLSLTHFLSMLNLFDKFGVFELSESNFFNKSLTP